MTQPLSTIKPSSESVINNLAQYNLWQLLIQGMKRMHTACHLNDFPAVITHFEAMDREISQCIQGDMEDEILNLYICGYFGCASVYQHLGKFEKAIELYEVVMVRLEHMILTDQEVKILTKEKQTEMFGLACAALGNLYGTLGKYTQAIDYYKKAINIWNSYPAVNMFFVSQNPEIVKKQIEICQGLEQRKKLLKIIANAFSLQMPDIGNLAFTNLNERFPKDAKGIFIKMYETKKSHPKASTDQSFGEKCFKDESNEFFSTQDEKIQSILMHLKAISDELKKGSDQISLAVLRVAFGSGANF